MSNSVLTRQQVRELDQRAIDQYKIPGIVLMENAGRGCVDTLCSIGIAGPVVICCGTGNNAGDGLVMARHLNLRGFVVKLIFWTDPDQLQGDAASNLAMVQAAELPLHICRDATSDPLVEQWLQQADWIVDAVLGTGARGEPRAPFDQVLEQLNRQPAKKLAVDVPSGLDCDSGHPAPHTFRADHTCTFVAAKPGLFAAAARSHVGQIHVLDIGAPPKLLEEFGVK
jgi:NAD(P)H-hydrate epimerase